MDQGLIQLLVIGFFVIVSLMDGAARKRRKQAQEMGHAPEPSWPQEEDGDPGEGPESSEGMVTRDLWEEIAALSRGEIPDRGLGSLSGSVARPDLTGSLDTPSDTDAEVESWDVPDEPESWARYTDEDEGTSQPSETRLRDLQSGYAHPDQAAAHERHAHERHAEGLSRSQQARSQQASAPGPSLDSGQAPSRTGASRGLLKGIRRGDRGALREAIILSEVLNPPVAFRDPSRRPPGEG